MNFKRGALKNTLRNRTYRNEKELYLSGRKQHKKDNRNIVASPVLIQAVKSFVRAASPESLVEHLNKNKNLNIRPTQVEHLTRGQVHGLTHYDLACIARALRLDS